MDIREHGAITRYRVADRPLAGQHALVTGANSGIGKAVAIALAEAGASVAVNYVLGEDDAHAVVDQIAAAGGRAIALHADVSREDQVDAMFEAACAAFETLDIVVANAGLATAASLADTSLDDWQKNMDVLAKGVFLIERAAFRVIRDQGLGGSIVTIGSKNALSASAGASAYCAAKAAALHFTRCLALEGAPLGIRANVVNPDAVLRGSRIWSGEWRKARAASYGVEAGELEEIYRQRSLLKRSVYPEDIAEAVHFFAGELSAKCTGNMLNVDAGNMVAFSR